MKYHADNSLSIGNTPLVQLRKVAGNAVLVLGKVEGRNPSYSVKCRIGASMIWDAEERGTLKPGMEIWDATEGKIDVLVSGVGTGGTITGVSRFIKKTKGRKILSVAVEPENSAVISQKLAGEKLKPGPHMIQGIGAGFIPDVLDLSFVDRVEQVGNEEAMEFARRLTREEGILSGISSGAAVAVISRLAKHSDFKNKNIVVILPDSGERYLSAALFE